MNIIILGWSTVSNGDISPKRFKKLGNLKVYDVLSEEEICKAAEDAEAILVNRVSITEKIINSAEKLKYIGSFATGYNNIDMQKAKEKGITVTNVPGYSTEAVATHTFGLLLALCLNIINYDKYVKSGGWSFESGVDCFPFTMAELGGKTLGIFGFGNIGKRVAELGSAFGMNVIFYSRSKKQTNIGKQVDFDTLLAESDFLTLHAPLNSQTDKILNKSAFEKMKKGACLINTARGGLVDENALADALNSGHIGGAALDVVTNEPLQSRSPLFTAKNCIFTPHVAWGPKETRERLISIGYENLKSFISNKPINVVEE